MKQCDRHPVKPWSAAVTVRRSCRRRMPVSGGRRILLQLRSCSCPVPFAPQSSVMDLAFDRHRHEPAVSPTDEPTASPTAQSVALPARRSCTHVRYCVSLRSPAIALPSKRWLLCVAQWVPRPLAHRGRNATAMQRLPSHCQRSRLSRTPTSRAPTSSDCHAADCVAAPPPPGTSYSYRL